MPAVEASALNRPDVSGSSNTSCFNNDGSPSSDVFCDLEGKDTCCGADWDCLANGLCRKSGTTSYAQGTCLNKAFDRCLSFCNQPQFQGFTEVSTCRQQGNNSWCCAGVQGQQAGGGQDCCITDATTLQPFPFSAIINHADGDRSTSSASTPAIASSTSRSNDAASSSTADMGTTDSTPPSTATAITPTSTRSTDSAVAGPPTSTMSTDANGPSSASTASTPMSPPSSSPAIAPAANQTSNNRGIIIGISTGGGLFVAIVLISLVFLYLKLRSVKQKGQRASAEKDKPVLAEPQPDLSITRHLHGYPPRELEGNIVREIDGQMISELDGTRYHELPDSGKTATGRFGAEFAGQEIGGR